MKSDILTHVNKKIDTIHNYFMLQQMDEQLTVKEKKRRRSYRTTESAFAPCLKVIMQDKRTILIPVDKASSDSQRSILVAKARDFVETQLERLKGTSLTPAEVKDLVRAVSDVDQLQREQYVTALNSEGRASGLGRDLQRVIRGAAQGAAEGTAAGFMEKMAKMDEAAKKIEEAKKVIQV